MIVLDCSAAVEIVLNKPGGPALSAMLEEIPGEEIIAPPLFRYEIVQALYQYSRHGYLTSYQAKEATKAALALINRFPNDSEDAIERLSEAMRLNHSAYDIAYLLLAKRVGATLFTLDEKLQKLCLENNVECIFTDKDFFTRDISEKATQAV